MCPKCRQLYVPATPPEPPPTEFPGPPARARATPARPAGAGANPARAVGMIPDTGPAPAAAPPAERLALRMPWRQQINLPDEGELVLGRSSPEFHAHPEASATHQISRRHVRFFRN